jgi:hypothetical protein
VVWRFKYRWQETYLCAVNAEEKVEEKVEGEGGGREGGGGDTGVYQEARLAFLAQHPQHRGAT